jgi:hypothetical protein
VRNERGTNFGRGDYVRHVTAPTFAELPGLVAELYAAGEVVPGADTPLSVVVTRTGKDLLRSLPESLADRGR